MVLDFKKFKKDSQNSLKKLSEEIEKMAPKNIPDEDKDFWKVAQDKAGNGHAVIRFLPSAHDDINFVRVFHYGFKNDINNRWYIEKSPKTIGLNDPVFDYNGTLWQSGRKDLQDQVRKQSKKTYFISNILVIKDSSNPENEGQVFKFKYGKKIWDKIMMATNPQFEDDPKFDPFNLWSGANFKLKVRKVEGYPNYDLSEFSDPSPILNSSNEAMSDDELESLVNKTFELQGVLNPSTFKSYEELKKRLDYVLGGTITENEDEVVQHQKPKEVDKPVVETTSDKPTTAEKDDDDVVSFLNSLMDEED